MRLCKFLLLSATVVFALPAAPQNTASNLAASAPTSVPPLVPYSGVINTAVGQTAPTTASVTFLIYNDETGGEPLFAETQSLAVSAAGHFKAQIGATLTNGLPIDLFASGEARWLAIQVGGEAPQPRVLLASVPYALKAADAATLGGLPASAFALAGTKSFAASAALTPDVLPVSGGTVTTPGGFSGYLPIFTGSSTITNSTIFQNANGIGIGGVAYAALDVSGRTIFRGTMVVSRNGNATSAAGVGSVPLQFFANGWNSAIHGPVQPVMQMQAEPTGNNTASPGATLNLLYSNGVTNEAETGLYFNANGTIHFAPGQTFPGQTVPGGEGSGTITGVTAGTALLGGGASGNVTLALDTTRVPLLAANNGFIGNQAITGNLTTSGTVFAATVNADNFLLGGTPFTLGSKQNGNAFLGFAGNSSTTGINDTAAGYFALASNTTGGDNTATGYQALNRNTTGPFNTASGSFALQSNTIGDDNTASGVSALQTNTIGSGNTASGSGALAFNTTGDENTASGYDVLFFNITGFGNTASGDFALSDNTSGYYNTASGSNALVDNTTGSYNTGVGANAGAASGLSPGAGSYDTAVGANTMFGDGSISNATAIGAFAEVNQNDTLVLGCISGINSCPVSTKVGIGTPAPDATLSVNGSADKPGGGSWATFSDGRLKTVNGSFGSGLDSVMKLRPIRYRYKADNALGIRDMDEHIGVVAQEVQRVIPEAVTENNKGYLLVNNDPILWSLVNAIQEQQREIEQRRTENVEQGRLLRAQSAVNDRQEKMLRAQSAVNAEQVRLLEAQGVALESLRVEVRETRKALREVKAQVSAERTEMVASK